MPEAPGLGVTLDHAAVERYRVDDITGAYLDPRAAGMVPDQARLLTPEEASMRTHSSSRRRSQRSLVACAASAQDYPNQAGAHPRAVPAGGASDMTARVLADKLTKRWGKAVFVENKAGANGIIGTETIASAEPDGYTLGLVASSHVANPRSYKTVPFALDDMTPVTMTAQVQLGLVVHPSVPANNVRELVALREGESGQGRRRHLGPRQQSAAVGARVHAGDRHEDDRRRRTRAAAPRIPTCSPGQTQVMFDAVAAVMPHVKAGKLKLLAVGGAKRSPFLPDVPTMVEAGVPGYVMASWGAMIVPAKTPKPIVEGSIAISSRS